jgi:hypothetical protein
MKGICVAFAAPCLAASPAWAQHEGHKLVKPDELKWNDVPSLPKGAKIAVIEGPMNEAVPFTVRLKLPADYKIPAHWHPAAERVTVLSGEFNMGIGEKFDQSKTQAVTPGAIMIMQPKTPHFGWTKTETLIQLHGTGPWAVNYVNPADDPRKQQ